MLEYVLPVPAGTAFTYHWYDGVPPLVGVGVNVTFVPVQIVVAVAVTDTEGVKIGLTFIVIAVEVAVVGEAQVSLEVISTVI